MKVVIDTNVLMSGVFFGGTPGRTLDAWRTGRFGIVISPLILDEYRRVGEELEARFGESGIGSIIDLVAIHASVIADTGAADGACRDPDDDKIIACAFQAGALVVTGDKDLLSIDGVLGVRVLSPRALMETLGK